MKLKPDEIQHIADLAKLELSTGESKLYAHQLTEILNYVEQIDRLQLPADTAPMFQAADAVNVFRDDQIETCPEENHDALLKAWPRRQGDLLESSAVFSNRNEDV